MESYKVHIFHVCDRMRDSSIFFLHTDPGKQIPISYYFWGLRTNDDFILIDTGFPLEAARKRNAEVTDFHSPEELLSTTGIDPLKIERIILTHLHWDHCASLDLFTNAIFFVQKGELEFFTGPLAWHPVVKEFIESDAILRLLQLNYQGRLAVVDGNYQIEPGIELIQVGGHTPGSQAVKISGETRDILITGDVVPLYRNLVEGIPPGIYSDLPEVLFAHQKIKGMGGSVDCILPGHDPAVADKYTFDRGVAIVS